MRKLGTSATQKLGTRITTNQPNWELTKIELPEDQECKSLVGGKMKQIRTADTSISGGQQNQELGTGKTWNKQNWGLAKLGTSKTRNYKNKEL